MGIKLSQPNKQTKITVCGNNHHEDLKTFSLEKENNAC